MAVMVASCFSSLFRVSCALIALVGTAALNAATLTWTGGGGDGNINNPANWSPAQSPTLNDVLIFGGLSNLAPQLNTAASVDSITFDNTAGAFTLGGSGTYTIGSGGITNHDTQTQAINNAIVLGANQTWNAAAGALVIGGAIDTNGFSLTTAGGFNMTLSGAISGSGGLVKTGAGTLTLTGGAANTYTGATVVEQGVLVLAKTGLGGALGGPLTIGTGANSATVQLSAAGQLDGTAVTVNRLGLLNLNGFNASLSSLTLEGGSVATAGGGANPPVGLLTIGAGGITSLASSSAATISGRLAFSGPTVLNIADGAAADDLTISAKIEGSFGLTKTGAGTLTLSNTNASFALTINEGVVRFTVADVLAGGTATVHAGGTLQLDSGTTTSVANDLTINGFGAAGRGALWSASTGSISGDVTLGSDSSIGADAGASLTIIGSIGGGFSLTKVGAGTLTLSGGAGNTYSGATFVNEGTLVLSKGGSIPNAITGALTVGDGIGSGVDTVRYTNGHQVANTSAVTIKRTGLLDLNGFSDLIGTLTFNGGSVTTGAGVLTLGGDVTGLSSATGATLSGNLAIGAARTFNIASGTLSREDLTISAAVSGGTLTKTGAGTLVLSGANTYTGVTTVNGGALNVRNSGALGSAAAGTIVDDGAEIQLQGGVAVGAEALTLNGFGASGSGALRNMSGNNSWAGNITIGATSLIEAAQGTLTLAGILTNGGNGSDFHFGGAGNTLVSGTITNNADVVKSGTGTLTLGGANTYTGTTIVNGGTMRVTGSINGSTGTALTFGGTGTFNANEAAGRAQGMGTLTFAAGDGTVQSTYGGSGNTSLTFTSLAPRGPGATGNFVVAGGTNGVTNRIVVNGLPTGFIDSNVFFNGTEYAYVDAAGYIRAINYGVDPGTAISPGGITLTGNNVKTNGHITSQGTQRFDTLHIAANINFNLGGQQKVTVNGILKTGNVAGGAQITGGDYLRADFDKGMTIRADRENDALNIMTPIIANGTNALTMSGLGTVTLSGVNTYTGGTFVNAGTLEVGGHERLLNTGALTVNGGTFAVRNFTETVANVTLVNGAITGNGSGTLVGTGYDVRSGSVSAILGGTAALTKTTDGTVTLTGSNTYTGTTTIADGTLVAAAPAGNALGGTTSVTVNADATLALGASDQINNTTPVILAGGTLSTTGGHDEGSSLVAGAGTLSLTADGSHIDFGTGTGSTLAFSIFNPGSFSLFIDNWTGTPGVIGDDSTDRLIFAADPTASLANFIFTGYEAGAVALLLDGGFYEVTPNFTPVPEMNPAVIASLLCAGVGVAFHRRAVRAKKRKQSLS